MAVVFDTSIIVLTLNPDAKPPKDPKSGAPLEHAKQRVDYLIRVLSKKKSKIVIPAPVLCEVLIHADAAANDYMKRMHQTPFQVLPFDSRAAIECAQYLRKYGIRGKGPANPRTKIKFYWQIMAIAQVSNSETVYSDDEDIFSYGQKMGIPIVRSFDLDLDPDDLQRDLDLEPPPIPQTNGDRESE